MKRERSDAQKKSEKKLQGKTKTIVLRFREDREKDVVLWEKLLSSVKSDKSSLPSFIKEFLREHII